MLTKPKVQSLTYQAVSPYFSPNVMYNESMEHLSAYIFQSNLEKALELIQNGNDINGLYGYNNRPISSAINSDNPATLKFVIAQGADVNIDAGAPLFETIANCIDGMIQANRDEPFPESMEMISILIKSGANPIIEDSEGRKPIDVLYAYVQTEDHLDTLKSIFRLYIPEVDNLIFDKRYT